MKRKIIILSAFIISLSFYSCEINLGDYLEGINEPPKLVLISFIEPGKNIKAELSSSYPAPNILKDDNVAGAIVNVYVNDVYSGTAEKIDTGDPIFVSDIHVNYGDRIKLTAEAPGYTPVTGISRIPAEIPDIKIDTITYYKASEERLQFKIHIPDNGDGTKYYRIILKGEVALAGYTDYTETYPIDEDFSKEPVFDENRHFNEINENDKDGVDSNKYSIFSNRSFIGKGYTVTVNCKKVYPFTDVNGDRWLPRITAMVMQLTPEAYLYLQSMNANSENSDDLVEPVQIYSNIENGIGIIGGYVSRSTTFKISPL